MRSLEDIVQAQTNTAVLTERWILEQPIHDSLQASLERLAERLDGIERALHLGREESDTDVKSWTQQAYGELTSGALSEVLARAIADNASAAWRSLPPAQREAGVAAFRRILVTSIVNELKFAQPAQCPESEPSPATLVFTGPPGVGKTTTLTKIAVQQFLNRRMRVQIVSVDPHHPSCHEKIRTLAGTIGANFVAIHTVPELRAALEELPDGGPVLIDTPGYAVSEREALCELAECLCRVRPRQTHLVLPAWMSKRDLAQIYRQYEPFSPDTLLFTQLDETEWYSAMIALALETRKPLSFFASGQDISEDLGMMTPEALFNALYEGWPIQACSTA